MQFMWDEKFYGSIVSKVETATQAQKFFSVYDITMLRYTRLVHDVKETYFVHPEGPYSGTKAALKKDLVYQSKKLIRKKQTVKFYGDAIRSAIEDACEDGGGVVLIPDGVYYTGAIEMKSNVEIHLADHAVLKFIRTKSNEFYPMQFSRWEGVECMNFSPFIYANHVENIAITGHGTLDGAADEFNWMPWKFGYFGEADQQLERERLFALGEVGAPVTERVFDDQVSTLRPPFIQPYASRNIRIENVHIINSPFWEINPVLCENVCVRGVHIETDLYNNDGIDPESSKDVLIESCSFLTGDDCIAIKSGRNNDGRRIHVPTENVVIRKNRFANGHGGITIGSEISGGVRNIFADGNYFDSPNLDYPIRFKTNAQRGGQLENIYVRNSRVNKSKIAVVYADFFYEEGRKGNYLPRVRNITVENFKTVEGGSIDAKYAFYLKGFTDAPIENITFKDMVLCGVKGRAIFQNVKELSFQNISLNGIIQEDCLFNVGDVPQGEEIVL